MKTSAEIRAFVYDLCEEEQYEPEEGRWIFRSGGDCFGCFDAAAKVARRFGGQVIGYWSRKNPAAAIGSNHAEGHDFALIGNRYIVDYWAFRIGRLIDDPVLDLIDRKDNQRATVLYGDRAAWEAAPAG
jgi:hypothetical protein